MKRTEEEVNSPDSDQLRSAPTRFMPLLSKMSPTGPEKHHQRNQQISLETKARHRLHALGDSPLLLPLDGLDSGTLTATFFSTPSLATFFLSARSFMNEGLVVQALALVRIPQSVANDAPSDARPEIVSVIELVDAGHHVLPGQVRILQVRKLVAAVVGNGFAGEKAFAHTLIVELGAGIGMGHGDLDGLAVQLLGVFDRLLAWFLWFHQANRG